MAASKHSAKLNILCIAYKSPLSPIRVQSRNPDLPITPALFLSSSEAPIYLNSEAAEKLLQAQWLISATVLAFRSLGFERNIALSFESSDA